jgi:hypothetical protein
VSSVEPIVIQRLLDDIERLKSEGTAMETAKINEERINEIRAAIMVGPIFNPSHGSQLSVDQPRDLLDRLTTIRDGLLAKDGVAHAKHSNYLLQRQGQSKQSIIWLAIFGFIFAATLLSLIR